MAVRKKKSARKKKAVGVKKAAKKAKAAKPKTARQAFLVAVSQRGTTTDFVVVAEDIGAAVAQAQGTIAAKGGKGIIEGVELVGRLL